jgi:phosphotransferase system HPr-like phosphotransfer protein
MAVMSLGAKKGQEILIKVEGENEAEDAANLKAFVQENL